MIHALPNNGGEIRRYSNKNEVLASNIFDKEFKLNVIHDTKTHVIQVFINDVLKLTTKDNGIPKDGRSWSFKTGVYALDNASPEMTLKVRDITLWKK